MKKREIKKMNTNEYRGNNIITKDEIELTPTIDNEEHSHLEPTIIKHTEETIQKTKPQIIKKK